MPESNVRVLPPLAKGLKACPVRGVGVLGFAQPTIIPCGMQEGHSGPHLYWMQWAEEDPYLIAQIEAREANGV